MKIVSPQQLEIAVGNAGAVSALLIHPADARACFVFAHGAGAGMTHASMEAVAAAWASAAWRRCAISFPIWRKAASGPTRPRVAHAAVRAAVAEAGRCCPGLRADRGRQIVRRPHDLAGAGERAACRRRAGWPFSAFRCIRPASRRSIAPRTSPISRSRCCSCRAPATSSRSWRCSNPSSSASAPLASLHLVEDADHSFHVPARSGRNDREVLNEILDAFAAWIGALKA